jgi:hypothetical protein
MGPASIHVMGAFPAAKKFDDRSAKRKIASAFSADG